MSAISNDKLLLFIPGLPNEQFISRLKARHPGLQVQWENLMSSNSTIRKPEELDEEVWEGVTLLMVFLPPPPHLMKSVRFVQLLSAGADLWAQHEVYKDPKVLFATANGLHPLPIAEWVIGSWLSHQRHFAKYTERMKTGYWPAKPFENPMVQDSAECRMGILGYGAIGRQCARLAQALGMEVYAYTRRERSAPEQRKNDSYCVPGTGDPDGLIPAKWFHGASREAVDDFLAKDLDILIISMPLTEETRGLISHAQFEILSKKETFLSNIARGPIVSKEALIEALEKGKIRGAALDVADPEPLPAEDPLWKAPNLLITPHVSWLTTKYQERLLAVVETNLNNLGDGLPIMNEVNRELHY